ncbi:Glutathione S-transferase T1 [Tetrabaena socialis]|uniref:Glutathione S-transferase T1 n=1 Tax=Tetrabaena socialis TaxID=47790 RepID=A0A2J8AHC4_9CHLO|nr:Glutathione S-transferase T1 [Tetrabaena socialis]|eukprot:PNH11919.1 Glutathione S-transferase T1 [Tetrabaena socialis]
MAPPEDTQQLRLYADFMSQPSRACIIFSRINGLPVEVRPVLIHKGETRSAAYLKLNPLGKVPLLEDPWVAAASQMTNGGGAGGGGLLLPESAAIMPYLSYRFPGRVAEHWYPRADAVARARVDAATAWYQGNIRAGAMKLVFNKVVAQRLGLQGDERVAADGLKTLQLALASLESYWLDGGSRPFMTGNQPCIADLLCCCELEQLAMLQQDAHGASMQAVLQPYSVVRAWRQRLREACAPCYGDAHATLEAAVRRAAEQRPAAPLARL